MAILNDFTFNFEAPDNGNYHIKIYITNKETGCELLSVTTQTDPYLFTTDLYGDDPDQWPITLTKNQNVQIYFDALTYFNNNQASFANLGVVFTFSYTLNASTYLEYITGEQLINYKNDEPTECEIFDYKPQRANQSTFDQRQNIELFNLNFGHQSIDDKRQEAPNLNIFNFNYIMGDNDEINEFVSFFKSKLANVKSFCLPSWQSEFLLSSDASEGDVALDLDDNDNINVGDKLFFYVNNDENDYYFTREVESKDANGYTIHITTGLPVDLSAGQGISKIYRVTFGSQELVINQISDSVAQCDLSFIEEIRSVNSASPDDNTGGE